MHRERSVHRAGKARGRDIAAGVATTSDTAGRDRRSDADRVRERMYQLAKVMIAWIDAIS